jgi:Tol biopolymer transport system component
MIRRYCFIICFIAAALLSGCKNATESEDPVTFPKSDLTRPGKFIALTSDKNGNEDIWIVQVDSTGILEQSNYIYPANPYNLTSLNSSPDRCPNWSSDGRILVFTRETGNVQELWAFFFTETGLIDPSVTSNPRLLFSSEGNLDNNASFSPDRNYMVFERRYDNDTIPGIGGGDTRDLYIGNISGSGNNFAVTNIRPVKTTPRVDEFNPKWSPLISIRRVLYDNISPYFMSDRDLRLIDPLDTTYDVGYYSAGRSGYAAWQPGCTRIAYESDYGNSGYYKLVVHRYPTENYSPVDLVQASGESNRYPSWQPNGEYITYVKYITPVKGKIYTIIGTGGTQQFLLPSEFDNYNNTYPAW